MASKRKWPKSAEARRALFLPAWVAALRSGKYKQGRSRRRGDDHFCCLGVGCNLGRHKAWEWSGNFARYRGPDGEADANHPPDSVLRLWGIGFADACELSSLNDCDEYTFEQIADWIEQRWPEAFATH